MTTAIVTGGAGFIGSHLVDALLAENISVRVIDNYSTGRPENLAHVAGQVDLVEADFAKSGSWQKLFQDVDWVFHLGALADIVPSIQRPTDYFQANVDGTFNVLEAAKNAGVKRFVYAASSSCYGIPEKYPTSEAADISPQYPYALTKRLGEELVMHWAQLYNLPAIALRLFNVYGPRSRTSGTYGAVLGVFLAQKLANKPFTVVGDGTQTRDFTYVTDVANAFLTAAQSSACAEIFNVGSGETVSVNRLVELLGGEVTYIPKRPGEPDCTYADITKIRRDLKWQPKVDIKQGVDNVLANIDYWKSAPVWTPATIATATQDWFKYLGSNDK
ncbi:putative UDP-glucose 4-epimerase [Acidimicrobiaceae bacterium]|nr:putative UDP-glucose 4-epimerase [Acidimicrobiaceae bacterium]